MVAQAQMEELLAILRESALQRQRREAANEAEEEVQARHKERLIARVIGSGKGLSYMQIQVRAQTGLSAGKHTCARTNEQA